MTNIPTRSIAQLPIATSISTNDTTVIQQSGITKSTTVGNLLASISTGVPSVLGYTALRTLYDSSITVPAGDTVFVRGVNAVGFGEGFFYYDNVATSSDNGGTVIVDNAGRRWLRVMDDIIDVKWFGAVGNGVTDDTLAIQSAINTAEDPHMRGNTVLLSSCSVGYALTSVGLTVGNGTSSGTFSTRSPITIQGQGAVSGLGPFNPTGGGALLSSVSGPALDFRGPMLGWGVNNVFISFNTSTATADGVRFTETQYGNLNGFTITGCPGTAIKTTTYGNNNVSHNTFNNINIYMPTYTSTATGLWLSGAGSTNTAHNSFTQLHIIPSMANQKLLRLGYCDANHFSGYTTNFQTSAVAINLDYTDGLTAYPCGNVIDTPDLHANNITVTGSAGLYPRVNPNRIKNLVQVNGTTIPQGVVGLVTERIQLQGDTNFYVSQTSGGNGNLGFLPNGAWATVQFAWDTIASYYDLNGYTAQINLGNDVVTTNSLKAVKPIMNGKAVINSSSTYVLGATNVFEFVGTQASIVGGGLESSSNLLVADENAVVGYSGVVFRSSGGAQILAKNGGVIAQKGAAFIIGGAQRHLCAQNNGVINVDNNTTAFLGAAAYSQEFARADIGGVISAVSTTYANSGSGSGTRYAVRGNGVINTNGGGANYFPGTSAGSALTGGQYL